MKKKILIHCPSNSVTGGPEALHQFCSVSQNFIESKMCYYTDQKSFVPKKFENYNVLKTDYHDDENIFHIIPEISTKYFVNKIKKGNIVIFWLSVDNYFFLKDRHIAKNIFYYFSSLLTHRKPIFSLKNNLHLSQSEYSNLFLKKNKFEYSFIGDYIRDECYSSHINNKNKKNIILYNPKKGLEKLLPIIKNSKYKFIALENLNTDKLRYLFQEAKLYIDFGRLPGKDRIPREALLNNCCILLGQRGAGLNDKDFVIPTKYKINLNNSLYVNETLVIIEDIFNNFQKNISEQEPYKTQILNEKKQFFTNVKNFIEEKIIK